MSARKQMVDIELLENGQECEFVGKKFNSRMGKWQGIKPSDVTKHQVAPLTLCPYLGMMMSGERSFSFPI